MLCEKQEPVLAPRSRQRMTSVYAMMMGPVLAVSPELHHRPVRMPPNERVPSPLPEKGLPPLRPSHEHDKH
ncbi:hypothetical protein LSTR_LSTR004644 [Laodelphax striatellus]|uniref:Uncharacterized protein n=1 Tax=Laodelphax striatellus TaxID=195883 RepID=A0A482WUI3_LAOST|nr:hypothetical protein LSTR_LSTR004644 [Laodelphax striatellus]